MKNFFEIYDRLIENIPTGIKVTGGLQHLRWTGVEANGNMGIAHTIDVDSVPKTMPEDIVGMDLRELAKFSKSWNFLEASYGVAAINCYYNTEENMKKLGVFDNKGDAFDVYQEKVKGKKVAVIGRFPFLEKRLGDICDLKVLERNISKGDYPDSACEFILPESDYVFMTGCTFVNKTVVRLLELSENAHTVIVGPTTPMTEILFDYGVNDLSGFFVKDKEQCKNLISNSEGRLVLTSGELISLSK